MTAGKLDELGSVFKALDWVDTSAHHFLDDRPLQLLMSRGHVCLGWLPGQLCLALDLVMDSAATSAL